MTCICNYIETGTHAYIYIVYIYTHTYRERERSGDLLGEFTHSIMEAESKLETQGLVEV